VGGEKAKGYQDRILRVFGMEVYLKEGNAMGKKKCKEGGPGGKKNLWYLRCIELKEREQEGRRFQPPHYRSKFWWF